MMINYYVNHHECLDMVTLMIDDRQYDHVIGTSHNEHDIKTTHDDHAITPSHDYRCHHNQSSCLSINHHQMTLV